MTALFYLDQSPGLQGVASETEALSFAGAPDVMDFSRYWLAVTSPLRG